METGTGPKAKKKRAAKGDDAPLVARDGLTERQRRFVEAYLETGNATQSAKRAAYKGNDVALAVQGARLLRTAKVARVLVEANELRATSSQLSRDARLQRLEAILLGEPMRQINPGTGKWTVGPAPPRDRLKAAELLGRMHADFVERVKQEGAGTLTELVDLLVDLDAKAKAGT